MWQEIFQFILAAFVGSFLYSFISAIVEMKQRNLQGIEKHSTFTPDE
jgi:hypothetical protein